MRERKDKSWRMVRRESIDIAVKNPEALDLH
jgi:hypothetical protein